MTKLPAPLALKKYILQQAHDYGFHYDDPLDTEEQINAAMSIMHQQIGYDAQQDVMEGQFETTISPAFSRHFEVESVAIQDNQGEYIGFSRFYGGGKHSDIHSTYEGSIADSCYLSCEEKEVLTIQRTWAKV